MSADSQVLNATRLQCMVWVRMANFSRWTTCVVIALQLFHSGRERWFSQLSTRKSQKSTEIAREASHLQPSAEIRQADISPFDCLQSETTVPGDLISTCQLSETFHHTLKTFSHFRSCIQDSLYQYEWC